VAAIGVIRQVLAQDTSQARLVDNDHVLKTFAPQHTDHLLRVCSAMGNVPLAPATITGRRVAQARHRREMDGGAKGPKGVSMRASIAAMAAVSAAMWVRGNWMRNR
jgi:hypothetical protein